MIDEPWFSAMLRFVVVVDGSGSASHHRSLVIIRAVDFDDAFRRALDRGYQLERTYLNGYGEQVRWRLEEVETLDQLDHELRDGREVYSETLQAFSEAAVPTSFKPEASRPTNSGV